MQRTRANNNLKDTANLNFKPIVSPKTLLGAKSILAKPQLGSFANEMAAIVQSEKTAGAQRDLQAFPEENFGPKDNTKAAKIDAQNIESQVLDTKLSEQMQDKLKDLRDSDQVKEQLQARSSEEAARTSEELTAKYSSTETQVAQVAQVNEKQITEAMQQGNVDQNQQQDANDRGTQLENWDELAPRIVEDAVNQAVRLDIPGLKDIETLIVRMNGGKVSIQAVGSDKTMAALQSQEAILAGVLAQHNVSLGSLQAIDKAKLATKGARRA